MPRSQSSRRAVVLGITRPRESTTPNQLIHPDSACAPWQSKRQTGSLAAQRGPGSAGRMGSSSETSPHWGSGVEGGRPGRPVWVPPGSSHEETSLADSAERRPHEVNRGKLHLRNPPFSLAVTYLKIKQVVFENPENRQNILKLGSHGQCPSLSPARAGRGSTEPRAADSCHLGHFLPTQRPTRHIDLSSFSRTWKKYGNRHRSAIGWRDPAPSCLGAWEGAPRASAPDPTPGRCKPSKPT